MPDPTALLHQLFHDEWEARLQNDPTFATYVGDRRFNHLLPVVTDEARLSWQAALRGFRQRQGQIERAALPASEQLNYDIFARLLDDEIAELGFHAYRMPISRVDGPHLTFPDLFQLTPFETLEDYEAYIARLKAFPRYVGELIELMRLGLRTGYIPPRVTLAGVDEALRAQLVDEPAKSVLYQPFLHFPAALSAADGQSLAGAAQEAIQTAVLPGFQALLDFLLAEYLPAARDGIAAIELPEGRAFYEHRIRYFTTLALSPEAIHQTGLEEVRRIRAEMEAIVRKTGFEGSFRQFIEFLRSDPRFYVDTPQALLQATAYVLKRMDGELPRLFKTLPRLPYGIRAIPDFAAPGNFAAYYMPGSPEGARAGFYYVNTYDLKSRPLYEIEALSLHEAVPGHHFQFALQQELTGLPDFRRFNGFTSFVEGWALYAERLGLEVGFYQDPYSDFGRLSYEMWRACRLVVDTGMHALGWTRQQAIDFMAENTSSTLLNITNEVDRYIAWPGQSLAYKLGELKVRELRARAEQALGGRFQLREFHDVLLLDGAVPLDVLENKVTAWIASQAEA